MSRSSSSPLKPKTFAKAKPALKPKLKPKASKIPTLQANRASSKAQTASKKTPTARKVTDSPLRERAKVNTGGGGRCNGTARTAGVSLAEGLNETASGRERAKLEPLPPSTPRAPSKQAQLIELLGSVSGGSMAHMIALTGWQAHYVTPVSDPGAPIRLPAAELEREVAHAIANWASNEQQVLDAVGWSEAPPAARVLRQAKQLRLALLGSQSGSGVPASLEGIEASARGEQDLIQLRACVSRVEVTSHRIPDT